VSHLKSRLEELKRQTKKAGDAYSRAYWQLDETEVRLQKSERRLAKTERQLRAATKRLNGRVNNMYRGRGVEFVDLLVGAVTYEEFATRIDYLQRIGSADAEALAEVKALKRRLLLERRTLLAQRKTRSKDLKKLRAQRNQLRKRLRVLNADFLTVKSRLDAARSGGRRPSGVRAVAGPNGMVFPVVGSYYYANTWGASRSGGRRSHKGTDIMAPHGTPCVAVLSGTVDARSGGLGGRTIWLTASNGWQFYYAHLSSWAVTSGHVSAGQVIGYVGSTGNASGGAPHLHFEIHPGGGGAVNPYYYLRSME
jgi:murein DD-endopeptidase MepM/ murein hydrolase activator NlpD